MSNASSRPAQGEDHRLSLVGRRGLLRGHDGAGDVTPQPQGARLLEAAVVREHRAEMTEETVRPRPLLSGRDLIVAGYTPGPLFKQILTEVEDAQLERSVTTPEEVMLNTAESSD